MIKAITSKKARAINEKLGLSFEDEDGHRTYWAAEEDESEIYSFDSKIKRDEFINRHN